MKRRNVLALLTATALGASLLSGCGQAVSSSNAQEPQKESVLETTTTESEAKSETTEKWPTDTLEIITPDSTGTGVDLRARILAPYLEKELGTTVIVTSKSGGGSTLCSQALMDAKNDGSTMMFTHNAFVATKIWGTVDFDHRDAELISNLFSDDSIIICAGATSGLKSMEDVTTKLEADPESVTTVCDLGSIMYLCASSLGDAMGVKFGRVDAGGVTERIATVVGGHADTVILQLASVMSYIESGELVPLAVLGDERLDSLPDVPTLKDLGYDWSWPDALTAAFFPPETDPALVARMDEALKNVVENPDFITEVEAAEGVDFTDYQSTEEAKETWEELREVLEAAYVLIQ